MIEVKTIVRTVINGKTYEAGEMLQLDSDEAKRLAVYGIVEPVESFVNKVETQQSFTSDVDTQKLSLVQLKSLAKMNGVKYSGNISKETLVKRLKDAGII